MPGAELCAEQGPGCVELPFHALFVEAGSLWVRAEQRLLCQLSCEFRPPGLLSLSLN